MVCAAESDGGARGGRVALQAKDLRHARAPWYTSPCCTTAISSDRTSAWARRRDAGSPRAPQMALGDDDEFYLGHKVKVYLVSLIYISYGVLSTVGMSVAAANPDEANIRFAAVVGLTVPSLHFTMALLGSLTTAGRAASKVEPAILISAADWLLAGALGAVATAVDIAGLEHAKQSVVIAGCASIAVAQLACFLKSAVLLDPERFDQVTGESLQTL